MGGRGDSGRCFLLFVGLGRFIWEVGVFMWVLFLLSIYLFFLRVVVFILFAELRRVVGFIGFGSILGFRVLC